MWDNIAQVTFLQLNCDELYRVAVYNFVISPDLNRGYCVPQIAVNIT